MKKGLSRLCVTCKKKIYVPLWVWKIKKNKIFFCSKACWIHRPSTIHICKSCGKQFRRQESNLKNKSGNLYCSRKCRYDDPNSYFKNGKMDSCKNCGKKFYKIKSSNKKYCSIECRSKDKSYRQVLSRIKRQGQVINCDSCGTAVYMHRYRLKKNKKHFCSVVCSTKANRGTISPKRNGEIVKCNYCGKEVYRARWRLEQYKSRYCSRACMNKQLINIVIIKPTKPEKKFMELIDKYKLPYKYVGDGRFWIGNKNPDFIHIYKKEVIEIFGDYWHNPALNKHCKYRSTEEGRQKIFKSEGFTCIIIWEKELNTINWEKDILEKLGVTNANICSTTA